MGKDWWTPEGVDAPTRGPAERKIGFNVTPENRARVVAEIERQRKAGRAGFALGYRAACVVLSGDDGFMTAPLEHVPADVIGAARRWLLAHPQGWHVAYRGVTRTKKDTPGHKSPRDQATAVVAFLPGDFAKPRPRARKEGAAPAEAPKHQAKK